MRCVFDPNKISAPQRTFVSNPDKNGNFSKIRIKCYNYQGMFKSPDKDSVLRHCHLYVNFLESSGFLPKISTVLFWIGNGKIYRTNAQNGSKKLKK